MRSVYAKILAWCFGVLVLSMAAFVAITIFVSLRATGRQFFEGQHILNLDQASEAYESGGAERLALYMQKLDKLLRGQHYFTDGAGKDLVTGEDHSSLLSRFKSGGGGVP